MLARRFTIVCLLVAIFGMSLAVLVAEKSRPVRAQGAVFLVCDAAGCVPPARR